MVGSYITFANGTYALITAFTSTTCLTVDRSQLVSSQNYYLGSYTTGTAGTGGVSSSTVTGSGTTWTSAMVGSTITFLGNTYGGISAQITGFTNSTTVTVSPAVTVAAGTSYMISAPPAISNFVTFKRPDGTSLGAIVQSTATTVAYNTSSDARLKENIVDTHYSLDTVLNLKVHDYNFITDSSKQQLTGFIAQELYQQFPDAVTVGTNEVDANGVLINPWQVDYGKLTPLLAKGIQDLNTNVTSSDLRLATAESDITALKQATTSTSILKVLADAKAINLTGDLTVDGNVVIKGLLETNGNNSGSVTVPAGQTTFHVTYPKAFSGVPKPKVTSVGLVKIHYGIINQTKDGFDIEMSGALASNAQFNWQSF